MSPASARARIGEEAAHVRAAGAGRLVVGAAGIALIGGGGLLALTGVRVGDYPGVVLWLAAAIVLHDGVLAPLVVAFGVLGRPVAARIGPAATAVARSALLVAAFASLVAIPGLVVRAIGPRNPTIHVTDYGLVLLIVWIAAVAVSVGAVVRGARSSRTRVARTK